MAACNGPKCRLVRYVVVVVVGSLFSQISFWYGPGGWFNIKMSFYQYRKSHCGDKTILWSSYLHNGISNTGKMTSLYWIGVLAATIMTVDTYNSAVRERYEISYVISSLILIMPLPFLCIMYNIIYNAVFIITNTHVNQGGLLVTWTNFNPRLDKLSHAQKSAGWNYLPFPEVQQLHHWSLRMDM